MIPKGSDPNGTLFKKKYHWGLTPLVLFSQRRTHFVRFTVYDIEMAQRDSPYCAIATELQRFFVVFGLRG
jgi:hypothetical protein